MARKLRRARRLVVDADNVYMWSVRHRHTRDDSGTRGCRTTLWLRREGTQQRLAVVFREGPGRVVSGGYFEAGAVVSGGTWLNLYEPGVARRFLDAATARGLLPDTPRTVETDGWPLFDAVSADVPAEPAD
ncbi:hypothetical protein ACTMTU_08970 [Streptomyces sp. OZ13]|uniref:hypothetical protein n=1 Tax=Streptomyces sp. OZ13 TaxID=3452210 RepID=UPI003F8C7F4C